MSNPRKASKEASRGGVGAGVSTTGEMQVFSQSGKPDAHAGRNFGGGARWGGRAIRPEKKTLKGRPPRQSWRAKKPTAPRQAVRCGRPFRNGAACRFLEPTYIASIPPASCGVGFLRYFFPAAHLLFGAKSTAQMLAGDTYRQQSAARHRPKSMPSRAATRAGRRSASSIRCASSSPRKSLQAGWASAAAMMPSRCNTWAVLCL